MVDKGWPLLPLGQLTENLDGRRVPVKEADRKPGPYPYYGASGVVDHVDAYLFDGEHLLIGEDGENLRTRQTPIAFLASGRFWVNNHAHIVRGNEKADTRYLCYALSQTDIGGYLTGSTMPKLTQGNMNRIPVICPPLPEQKRIAHILGTLDDKIELNRRMNATLEEMARALFKSWFESLASDLPPRRVQELIDEGVLAVGDGYRAKRSELAASGLPFARAGNLNGEFHLEDAEFLGDPGVRAAGEKVSQANDVVITSKGTVGRIAMVSQWTPQFVYAPQLCYWRVLKPQMLSPHVLFQWMHASEFGLQLASVKGQTDMADYVSLQDQRRMWITLPPPAAQKQISGALEPLFAQRAACERESRVLAALRDTLLPKLLSGDLTLRDAGHRTGRVAC